MQDQQIAVLIERLDRIATEMERYDELLFGKGGSLGLAQQVKVMWRIHVWILCTLSAIAGSILTAFAMRWIT
jgi:hypothetical protein